MYYIVLHLLRSAQVAQDAQSTLLHFNRMANDKNKNLSKSFSISVQTSSPMLCTLYVRLLVCLFVAV